MTTPASYTFPPDVALHAHCLSPEERAAAADALSACALGAVPPPAAWRALARAALRPEHPFALHRALYAAAYAGWDPATRGPRPVWIPGPEEALGTNAAAFMASFHGDAWWRRRRTGDAARDWPLLQRVSVQSPELFWSALLRDALRVRFDAPPTRVLDETGLLGDGDGGGGGGGGAGCGCGSGSGGKGGGEQGPREGDGACCSEAEQPPPVALGPDSVRWLPGARLNVAAAALLTPNSPDGGAGDDGGSGSGSGNGNGGQRNNGGGDDHRANDPWSAPCCDGESYESGATPSPPPALVWAEDGRPRAVRRVSWPALRARAARVARALERFGVARGESVAIDMPMSCDAVAIYLGIVLHGAVVVSIADSFAPSEIAVRLRASRAVAVFTQDVVPRGGGAGVGGGVGGGGGTGGGGDRGGGGGGGAALPLFARVVEARAPRAVVLPAARVGRAWGHEQDAEDGDGLGDVALRPGDLSWGEFLSLAADRRGDGGDRDGSPPPFRPCSLPGDAPSNILFSSGTTGEPKAVAWSHLTPLRAAADAWAHQDVRPGDRLCWPTNLGWMMGPWLVYAALLNGAAVALYHGPPGGADFCAFVAAARVTQLGLVPSIVRAWRAAPGLLGPAQGGGGERAAPGLLGPAQGGGGERAAPGLLGPAQGGGGERAAAGAGRGGGGLFLPDWSALRCFSSTGEASAPDDYHWLASRARGYRPVIEYCGGTEIGGAFLSGSLLQAQAPSAFSTPTLGAALVLLGAGGEGSGGVGQSMHGARAPPFVG